MASSGAYRSTIGFWTALLANRYHAWLEGLRLLRNRIAHHEPVFEWSLRQAHSDVLTVPGYLSPDARRWVAGHARVGQVLRRRDGCVLGTAPTSF